ncbi:putative disease resistance protein At3g14460 [Humulus lupulus]|uniref:putative disease resistance protein At3g14460 n=1 Tax=Humulus lupulus TaxID=3486 RepID=UPI002B417BAA|nr:putative disease resistance protein At3g14460 [Humulus lupulus]
MLVKFIPSSSFNEFDEAVKPEKVRTLEKLIFLVDKKYELGLMENVSNRSLMRLPSPWRERLIAESFELKVWVTVSEEFDVCKIMRMIFQKVTSEKCDIDDLSELQCELKKALRGKNKIIVTTRNKVVAQVMSTGKVHKLQGISNEDCWRIFVDQAFEEDIGHAHSKLHEIVKKCKGLPLAVKSLVSKVMYGSYSEFEKKQLILLWMAEGLLQNKKGKSMVEVGEQYFEDLISRSFFQETSQHKSSKGTTTFLMHDLVHKLASFVAGEFCFRLDDDNSLDNLATKTRHLSCMTYIEKVAGLSKAESLHTLLTIKGRVLLDLELHEVLPTLGCLRVLSVFRSFKLSDSIGKLKHLRYLNLSSTEIVPDSLPKNMKRLNNLRHLDTSFSPLEMMPQEWCRLINLQTLTNFVLGKVSDNERKPGFASIKELGELHHLQGKLLISRLHNTDNVQDVLKANLKDKDGASQWNKWLCIRVGDDRECMQGFFPCLKELHLSACPNLTEFLPDSGTLETITISGCRNLNFLENKFYTSLRNLDIYGTVSDSMESLSLDHFPNLNKLRLRGCGNIKQLTRGSNYFPKLKSLDVRHCQNLESFTITSDEPVDNSSTVLHSLSSIKVIQCNKSRSLPAQMGTMLPSLGLFLIEECPEVEIFPQGSGFPSSLIHLLISKCSRLVAQHSSWDLQRLAFLSSLTIEDCDDIVLESFPWGLLPTSLTYLSLQNLPHLKSLNGDAFRCVASLEELWTVDC